MTDKEKYDFIDHVVHLTLFAEDRLLHEHGGEYSRLQEDGIDSNEYYRIITERVISILKKNKNYMQEEPVSEDLEKAAVEAFKQIVDTDKNNFLEIFKAGANWKKKQLMAKAIEGNVLANGMGEPILHLLDKGKHLIGKKVKVVVIEED